MDLKLLIPFTKEAKQTVDKLNISIIEPDKELLSLTKNTLIKIFKNEFSFPDLDEKYLKEYFVVYPFARIILSHINKDRFYDLFSKFYFNELKRNLKDPKIAFDLLELNYKIKDENYLIPFEIYIKAKINSEKDKLTNQNLKNGFVYLDKDKAILFAARFVSSKVIENLPLDISETSKNYKIIANELDELFKPKTPKYVLKAGKTVFENFPPCMSRILNTMLEKGNPSHMERYYFATFCFTIKMDFDSVLNIFKNTSDYDERIAKYQLLKIQKYPCSNCDTMKSMGLCFPDDFCKYIKSPVGYYLKKTYNRDYKEDNNEKENKEEN